MYQYMYLPVHVGLPYTTWKWLRYTTNINIEALTDWCLTRIQGVLLLKPQCTPEGSEGGEKIVRLWVHEVYRVIYDRLVDDQDRQLFFDMVKVGAPRNSYNKKGQTILTVGVFG